MLRFFLSQVLPKVEQGFPWSTFVANILASFLLALLIFQFQGRELSQQVKGLLIIGFCGGFSTFSTFGLELFTLLRSGQTLIALAYLLSSLLLSIGLFYLLSIRMS